VTSSFGWSPMSMLNIRTFGVTVDILLLKQYLYNPSECAANVYLPLVSRSPAYILLPSGPVIYKYSTTFKTKWLTLTNNNQVTSNARWAMTVNWSPTPVVASYGQLISTSCIVCRSGRTPARWQEFRGRRSSRPWNNLPAELTSATYHLKRRIWRQ